MVQRALLLTGITGFVGGALAARWNGGALVAIVRARTVSHGRERVAASVARFVGPEAAANLAGAATIVPGDLADPRVYDHPAFDTVTHALHAAACTSFASTRRAWSANVEGTSRLAERMQRVSRLERFVHVSSAYVCGDRPGPIVHEEDAPPPDHGYVNEYSRTKAEAERRLLAMRSDLPLVIARPSVIIGHARLGVRPSSSLFWYYRALAALGAGPFPASLPRDIVPVDYVADALAFLLDQERLAHRSYHVSAGSAGAVAVERIVASLDGRRPWRIVCAAELAEMENELGHLCRTNDEARSLARGLAACARFGELGVESFDNARLLSAGFRPPPRFTDYVSRCVETSAGSSVYDQMVDGD